MAAVVTRAPALMIALAREHLIARRSWKAGPPWAQAPCRTRWYLQQGRPFLLVETGIGPAAAQRAIDWLLPETGRHTFQPSVVISAGFSGALQPGQRVGDLILAGEVLDEAGQLWPLSLPSSAHDLLSCCGPLLQTGRIVTTSALVGGPVAKRALGQKTGALAVDMESAVLARRCQEQGVPLVCLRVVSDDVETSLSPQLAALLKEGQVRAGRLAGAVLRRPALLRELWQLAGHTRQAARRLAGPLNRLLQAPQASLP